MQLIATLTITILLIALGRPVLATDAGFQTAILLEGRPLDVGIWYPTTATAGPHRLWSYTQDVAPDAPIVGNEHPLVVISHGSGGWFGGHYDTAIALAKAGFVVAAVTHEGDSVDDTGRRVELWVRTAQLHRLVDYMVSRWQGRGNIEADRIGAFGFSAGGFTVLVAAGGTPDLTKVVSYCRSHADTETCRTVRAAPDDMKRLALPMPASTWTHEPRIKAAVVAAPAVGFSFGKQGLGGVGIPMQLWRAEFDHVLPYPDYAEAVQGALPIPPEYHVVQNADHYDFLPPCTQALANIVPTICQERQGFDRAAFHARFNDEVVNFFQRTLR